MQLSMYIGNRLIDIITLNPDSIKADGYMQELKHNLEKAHEKIIATLQVPPVYMIETVS